MSSLTFVGVIPAAGIGSRMHSRLPKQYLHLAGQSVLEHSIQSLLADRRIEQVVLALHPLDSHYVNLPIAENPRVRAVIGGATRSQSVLNALKSLPIDDTTIAVVHDAARPCLAPQDLARLLDACSEAPERGAILASEVRDTMKRSLNGGVSHTEPRENLWHALTPQAFIANDLVCNIAAAEAAGVSVTDESSAMEWANCKPQLVPGLATNIKVTRPGDLEFAEWVLLRNRQESEQCV